nr:olfactory receptor 14A16-like [Pelodiscus sinensis]|eukprot:XP_025034099.1 olfactory receptor 14A16-like [Pelodiscus sinensis]
MSNHSTMAEFLLRGFSDVRELQVLHFVLFLVFYLAALVGNLLVTMAIALNHQLQTPMYFFLVNLSIIDFGTISITVPKSMSNSLLDTKSISYAGCFTQVFLFIFLVSTEVILLTVMAYDRYVAVCHPLHYERVMNQKACVHLAAGAWLSGFLYSALHTGNTLAVSLCGSLVVDQFFCDIPQLLKLACHDSGRNEIWVIAFSTCFIVSCFVFIIVSYVQIFRAVLRIPSEQGRHKAFSTCLPHLAVVSLFFSTGMFAYLKPIFTSTSRLDLVVDIFYSVVPPMLNPVIYSMRNKEIKAALWKLIGQRLFMAQKMSLLCL